MKILSGEEVFGNMSIKSLLERLRTSKEAPIATIGFYFERYTLIMLRYLSNKEQKPIFANFRFKGGEFDTLLPLGIFDIEGPTIVEVKMSKDVRLFEKKLRYFISETEVKIKSLLIIFGVTLSGNDRVRVQNVFKNYAELEDVVIWDIDDLENKLFTSENMITKSNEIIENIDNLNVIKNISEIEKSGVIEYQENGNLHVFQHEQVDKQEALISELAEVFKSEGVNFFLGAGVSVPAGIPTWNNLLRGLSGVLVSEAMKCDLNYLEERILAEEITSLHLSNPLLGASYIGRGLREKFLSEINVTLYKEYVDTQENGEILETIAQAIVKHSGNSGVRKIITYNFDDLLEREILMRDSTFSYKSVFTGSGKPMMEFPIYHVHGFLPYDGTAYTEYELEKQEIVFDENSYHKLQIDHYAWQNLEQVIALRERVSVLIGLSVTDPNLRRLLDLVRNQTNETKHFAIIRRQFLNNVHGLKESVYHEFFELHHRLLEEDFEKLGVKVIWYDQHEDIPLIIRRFCGV